MLVLPLYTRVLHDSDSAGVCDSQEIITPRAHARSGVKQSVLSVSLSVCQSVSLSCGKIEISPHRPS